MYADINRWSWDQPNQFSRVSERNGWRMAMVSPAKRAGIRRCWQPPAWSHQQWRRVAAIGCLYKQKVTTDKKEWVLGCTGMATVASLVNDSIIGVCIYCLSNLHYYCSLLLQIFCVFLGFTTAIVIQLNVNFSSFWVKIGDFFAIVCSCKSRIVFYEPVCFDHKTPVTFGLPHSLPASLLFSSCLPVIFQFHRCRFVWCEKEMLVLLNQTSKQHLFLCLSYFVTVNITPCLVDSEIFWSCLKKQQTTEKFASIKEGGGTGWLVVSRLLGPQFPQTPNWAQGRPGALWSSSFTNKYNYHLVSEGFRFYVALSIKKNNSKKEFVSWEI